MARKVDAVVSIQRFMWNR